MVGGGSKQEGIKLCGDSNKHFGDRVVGRFAPPPRRQYCPPLVSLFHT